MVADVETQSLIAELRRKYLWWEPIGSHPPSENRILAQAMNFATYDDVLRLERAIGAGRLTGIMTGAEPGWFSDRSWEFWRGRLSFSTGAAIPDQPPRRSIDARVS